jgi:hypothetical protein
VEVAWVPFGPATPSTPSAPERWYGKLWSGDCADTIRVARTEEDIQGSAVTVRRLRDLYAGAGSACLAARDGGSWAEARAGLAAGHGLPAPTCREQKVIAFIETLVSAHDAGRRIALGPPAQDVGHGTACGMSVGPVRQPAVVAVGETVTLTVPVTPLWEFLVTVVRVGTQELQGTELYGQTTEIEVTASFGAPGRFPVTVVLDGGGGELPAGEVVVAPTPSSAGPAPGPGASTSSIPAGSAPPAGGEPLP